MVSSSSCGKRSKLHPAVAAMSSSSMPWQLQVSTNFTDFSLYQLSSDFPFHTLHRHSCVCAEGRNINMSHCSLNFHKIFLVFLGSESQRNRCGFTEMAASNVFALAFALLFALLGLQGVRGAIKCEELPAESCAFSVSSTGARCVLEKYVLRDGSLQFQCQPSTVMAEKMLEWIESDECLNACGLARMSVGMSSDSLLEAEFTSRLCSENCQNNCPNIVDLYLNLAAAEGIYLPRFCEAQSSSSRRQMAEVLGGTKLSSITYHSFGAPPPGQAYFGDLSAAAPSPL